MLKTGINSAGIQSIFIDLAFLYSRLNLKGDFKSIA